MNKRLELRISDEEFDLIEAYCKKTGASKTGAIKMLLKVLKDEQLLAIVRESITVDFPLKLPILYWSCSTGRSPPP